MEGGWAGQVRQWRKVTKTTELWNAMWSEYPCTLEPILSAVCEKNIFRFFHSTDSGKQHLSYSSSQKWLEKASNKMYKNMVVLHLC